MARRCITSLRAGRVDSVWSPAPAGGGEDNARRRFIGGGPGRVSIEPPPNDCTASVLHTASCVEAASRPRAADGQCGTLIESSREKRSRKR